MPGLELRDLLRELGGALAQSDLSHARSCLDAAALLLGEHSSAAAKAIYYASQAMLEAAQGGEAGALWRTAAEQAMAAARSLGDDSSDLAIDVGERMANLCREQGEGQAAAAYAHEVAAWVAAHWGVEHPRYWAFKHHWAVSKI